MILNKHKIAFFIILFICPSLIMLFSLVQSTPSAKINNSVKNQLINEPKTSATSTYLIVTTDLIEDNSKNLTDFIKYKESLGFTVEVITEDEYGSATGQARAINIRNWLIDNYEDKNIEYVLLIGDPDPDDPSTGSDSVGDVPMLMCWPRRYAPYDSYWECPTDYFYADLTGTWDGGDGYYGEYTDDKGVDFEAEVYVGRIPVYSANYISLDAILKRTINHHDNAGAEKNKILLPMAISNYEDEDMNDDGFADNIDRTDGLDCPYYVWNYIASDYGMSDTVMYEIDGIDPVLGGYRYDMPLTKNNFITEFNKDQGAVFWWAHGGQTGASRKYWDFDDSDGIPEPGEMDCPDFIDSGDMLSLDDDKPAFFFQSSCLNGYPENSDNLGYALLKQGAAISTVSASRVSWYRVGDWYPSRTYADNTGIGYYYMDGLMYGWSAGKALYEPTAWLYDGFGAESWMNKMDFNLYGDPSLGYWEECGPTSSSPSTPAAAADDDGGSSSSSSSSNSIEGYLDEYRPIIIASLIGVGALTAGTVIVLTKRKGKQPSRDMDPFSFPPSSPPPSTDAPSGQISKTTIKSTTPHSVPSASPPPSTNAPSSQLSRIKIQSLTPPRFCTKCGTTLKLGSNFCVNCGQKTL